MNTIGNAPFNVQRLAVCVLFACNAWHKPFVDWQDDRLRENMLKFGWREMFNLQPTPKRSLTRKTR